jgi:hypothetical protein
MGISEILAWIVTNGPGFLAAINAVLTAVIALCLLIPGEQPEKFLQSIVDLLKKVSRK